MGFVACTIRGVQNCTCAGVEDLNGACACSDDDPARCHRCLAEMSLCTTSAAHSFSVPYLRGRVRSQTTAAAGAIDYKAGAYRFWFTGWKRHAIAAVGVSKRRAMDQMPSSWDDRHTLPSSAAAN